MAPCRDKFAWLLVALLAGAKGPQTSNYNHLSALRSIRGPQTSFAGSFAEVWVPGNQPTSALVDARASETSG
jgi:hypothetical protein